MRLHVSMRCSTPLCHGAYDSFHVFRMAKKHVFKIRTEDFVAVEAAVRIRTSP